MPGPRIGGRAALLVFLLVLLAGGGAAAAAAAPADETVSVDVGVVYASNQGSSIDPALSNLRGNLNSMFNYSSYKMLDRKRQTLGPGQTGDFGLPGGRAMHIAPLSVQGKKVRLSVVIQGGGKNLLSTTLGLSRGGMVLVGGPSHEAGVLILILSAD